MPTYKPIVLALVLVAAATGCTHHNAPTKPKNADLTFSQCMRDQGLTWFPDRDANGGLKVSVPDGVDQSTFDKAEQACKAYAPGANRSGPISDADFAKLRQMAQCIRDHGFAKYPDPDANGSINIDSKELGVAPDDPAFEKARQDCQKYLPPRKSPGTS
jgi:hypothetical protein